MAARLPQVMRAAQLSASPIEQSLRINTKAPLPKNATSLRQESVLVKVASASLNPIESRLYDSPMRALLPKTPGLDFAGRVVDSRISHLKAGDRVFGTTGAPAFGALADYLVVPKSAVAHAPDELELHDLSTVGTAGVAAYQSIAPFIKPGDRVLVNGGSGGVGSFAIQIAARLGAEVTAVCSRKNVEFCRQLGAKEVVDYTCGSLVQTLRANGTIFDHVFDTAFKNFDLYWQSQHYLKEGGKYVTIAGDPSFSLMWNMLCIFLLPKALGGGQRPFQFMVAKPSLEDLKSVAAMMAAGNVKPAIDMTLSLQDAAKGYATLKTGHARGKIVVNVANDA